MARCYILGAGFSKACGLPLASELTEQIFDQIAAHNDPSLAEFIKWPLQQWTNFLKKLYPSCDFIDSWPDFEDLITLLDEWELYRADFEQTPPSGDPMQPAHLKRMFLKDLAVLLCSGCQDAVNLPEYRYVKDFVRSVSDCGDSVISFNWDLLLEIAGAEIGIPVFYQENNDEGLYLIKPHGSINLAGMLRSDYEKLKNPLGSDGRPIRIINDYGTHIEFEENDFVVVRSDDPRDSANRIVHYFDSKDVLLVEPTARKSYKSPWLRLQWRCAVDAILAADEIIIIGFSLPPTDFRPRALLQIAGMKKPKPARITIVDPAARELY